MEREKLYSILPVMISAVEEYSAEWRQAHPNISLDRNPTLWYESFRTIRYGLTRGMGHTTMALRLQRDLEQTGKEVVVVQDFQVNSQGIRTWHDFSSRRKGRPVPYLIIFEGAGFIAKEKGQKAIFDAVAKLYPPSHEKPGPLLLLLR